MRPGELRDEDLPAAFWETLPDDNSNADLAAIRALEAESTPEERAENYKVRRKLPRLRQTLLWRLVQLHLVFAGR